MITRKDLVNLAMIEYYGLAQQTSLMHDALLRLEDSILYEPEGYDKAYEDAVRQLKRTESAIKAFRERIQDIEGKEA